MVLLMKLTSSPKVSLAEIAFLSGSFPGDSDMCRSAFGLVVATPNKKWTTVSEVLDCVPNTTWGTQRTSLPPSWSSSGRRGRLQNISQEIKPHCQPGPIGTEIGLRSRLVVLLPRGREQGRNRAARGVHNVPLPNKSAL